MYLDDKSLHTWVSRQMVHKIDEKIQCVLDGGFVLSAHHCQQLREPTILVTNRWNRHRFTWIFWKNSDIYSLHLCSRWNVPSPSPMLSLAYFGVLRWLQYTNQHWGMGNEHKCFKIWDEYCSCSWQLSFSFPLGAGFENAAHVFPSTILISSARWFADFSKK